MTDVLHVIHLEDDSSLIEVVAGLIEQEIFSVIPIGMEHCLTSAESDDGSEYRVRYELERVFEIVFHAANNLESFWKQFENTDGPKFVILDVMIGEENGASSEISIGKQVYETLLRKNKFDPTKVAFVTGYPQESIELLGLSSNDPRLLIKGEGLGRTISRLMPLIESAFPPMHALAIKHE